MLYMLTGAALLALGFFLGRRSSPRAVPPPPDEAQRLALQEEHDAFAQLMGYNQACAYGAQKGGGYGLFEL